MRSGRVVAVVALVLAVAACGGSDEQGLTPAPRAVAPTSTVTAPSRAKGTTPPTTEVTVGVEARIFTDASRTTLAPDGTAAPGRELVTRLWVPSTTGPRPLIVLAHGLNGEPDKFDELSRAWAGAGYVVAAPRFPLSSSTGGGRADDLMSQPADVSFVIDQLLDDPSVDVDEDRIGVAGLSLGGSTVYALVTDTCCRDDRIKAAAVFDGLHTNAFAGGRVVPNEVPVLSLHCDQDFVLPFERHATPGFARMQAPAWLVSIPCQEHSQPYEDTQSAFDDLVRTTTLELWTLAFDGGAEPAPGAIVDAVDADGRATVDTKS